jgi:CheY-like chemotaxis protein
MEKKILLVEDDNYLRTILSSELGDKYTIINAQDGEEALQIATDFKIDLILLDINIPKMDGLTVLEHIRQHPDPGTAGVKTIVFTNLTGSGEQQKAKQLGVLDYVIKSGLSLDQVLGKISHALESPAPQ